jgi:SAM-dependent methyltransferase
MATELLSRDEAREYLLSFDLFEQTAQPEEWRNYVETHLGRLLMTLRFLPPLPRGAQALELGADPYFMTLLLRKYTGYELRLGNYSADYGQADPPDIDTTVHSARFGETHTFHRESFNVELAPFPFVDGAFDIVLCCEILEHLIMDPSHMLREIHRVLKPGGYLLLTTPNFARLENALSLLRGNTILHPYSGFGVYGRHNREYTPRELDGLLRQHNFAPLTIAVEDAYPHELLHRWLTRIGPLRWRRDNIFAVAQAYGTLAQRYPSWLYAHQWARHRVTRNTIVMGDGEILQLGPGWHTFEAWGGGICWTGREATAYLKPQGRETMLGLQVHTGPDGARGEVLVQGQLVGEYPLSPGGPQELVFPLPERVCAEISAGTRTEVDVHIVVANPFVPGPQDSRELGLAVSRIWLA